MYIFAANAVASLFCANDRKKMQEFSDVAMRALPARVKALVMSFDRRYYWHRGAWRATLAPWRYAALNDHFSRTKNWCNIHCSGVVQDKTAIIRTQLLGKCYKCAILPESSPEPCRILSWHWIYISPEKLGFISHHIELRCGPADKLKWPAFTQISTNADYRFTSSDDYKHYSNNQHT